MKYYQMHEKVYQGLKDRGFISWDKETEIEAIWSHQINRTLGALLQQHNIILKDLETLDLGTGTGTCALFCAKEGAKSTGVDISTTAIELADKNKDKLGLDVNFLTADILSLNLDKTFDFISDSSLLHCIVGFEDRMRFYKVVQQHLKAAGYFYMHTMVTSSDMSNLSKEYFHLEDDVLYSLGISEIIESRKTFNGKSYFPHRTIKSIEALKAEISEAGFEIISSHVVCQVGEPGNFVGLLRTMS